MGGLLKVEGFTVNGILISGGSIIEFLNISEVGHNGIV